MCKKSFKKLFKNPGKLMNLVKSVGNKLDTKIKSGDIKESELMREASDIMEKMSEKQKQEPIYVGNGIEKFNGNLIEISVCLTDVEKHKYDFKGKNYVKLKVSKKKQVDEYGKTHSVQVNLWKPKEEEY